MSVKTPTSSLQPYLVLGRSLRSDRIQLVNEDDCRCLLPRRIEELTNTLGYESAPTSSSSPGSSPPTPTNISSKLEPEANRNGTPASPATARASIVFPVPGGPVCASTAALPHLSCDSPAAHPWAVGHRASRTSQGSSRTRRSPPVPTRQLGYEFTRPDLHSWPLRHHAHPRI